MDWKTIGTLIPKPHFEFLGFQNGEIYHCRFTDDKMPRLCFRGHSLFIGEKYQNIKADISGEIVDALVKVGMPWEEEYRHDWVLWTRGFDLKLTAWAELTLPNPTDRSE